MILVGNVTNGVTHGKIAFPSLNVLDAHIWTKKLANVYLIVHLAGLVKGPNVFAMAVLMKMASASSAVLMSIALKTKAVYQIAWSQMLKCT